MKNQNSVISRFDEKIHEKIGTFENWKLKNKILENLQSVDLKVWLGFFNSEFSFVLNLEAHISFFRRKCFTYL